MNRDHFWLTDDQFSKIEPHLPTDTRGKARVDDRRVISGIINVLKSGGRWVDAPPEYGPRKTLYNRFVRWEKGAWVELFRALAQAGGPPLPRLKRHRTHVLSVKDFRGVVTRYDRNAVTFLLAAVCI